METKTAIPEISLNTLAFQVCVAAFSRYDITSDTFSQLNNPSDCMLNRTVSQRTSAYNEGETDISSSYATLQRLQTVSGSGFYKKL
jgi:hypothetical protein